MSSRTVQQDRSKSKKGCNARPSAQKRQRAFLVSDPLGFSQDGVTVAELNATIQQKQQLILLLQQELFAVNQNYQVLYNFVCALGIKLPDTAGAHTDFGSVGPSSPDGSPISGTPAAHPQHIHNSSKTNTDVAAPKCSTRKKSKAVRQGRKSTAGNTAAAPAAVSSRAKAVPAATAASMAAGSLSILPTSLQAAEVPVGTQAGTVNISDFITMECPAFSAELVQAIHYDVAEYKVELAVAAWTAATADAPVAATATTQLATELGDTMQDLPEQAVQSMPAPAACAPSVPAHPHSSSSSIYSNYSYQLQQQLDPAVYQQLQQQFTPLADQHQQHHFAPLADCGSGTLPVLGSGCSSTTLPVLGSGCSSATLPVLGSGCSSATSPTAPQPGHVTSFDGSSNSSSFTNTAAAAAMLSSPASVGSTTPNGWPNELVFLEDKDCDTLMEFLYE